MRLLSGTIGIQVEELRPMLNKLKVMLSGMDNLAVEGDSKRVIT